MTVAKGQDGKLEWKEEDLGLDEDYYSTRKGRKIMPREKGRVSPHCQPSDRCICTDRPKKDIGRLS